VQHMVTNGRWGPTSGRPGSPNQPAGSDLWLSSIRREWLAGGLVDAGERSGWVGSGRLSLRGSAASPMSVACATTRVAPPCQVGLARAVGSSAAEGCGPGHRRCLDEHSARRFGELRCRGRGPVDAAWLDVIRPVARVGVAAGVAADRDWLRCPGRPGRFRRPAPADTSTRPGRDREIAAALSELVTESVTTMGTRWRPDRGACRCRSRGFARSVPRLLPQCSNGRRSLLRRLPCEVGLGVGVAGRTRRRTLSARRRLSVPHRGRLAGLGRGTCRPCQLMTGVPAGAPAGNRPRRQSLRERSGTLNGHAAGGRRGCADRSSAVGHDRRRRPTTPVIVARPA
jgi:hypothetical protein